MPIPKRWEIKNFVVLLFNNHIIIDKQETRIIFSSGSR